MTAPSRPPATTLLVLGGLTWLPARYGVMTTWQGTWAGLDYVGWNRASLVPLALLAAGALVAARSAAGRAAAAWTVVASGFGLSWLGVVLEFVIGGGLRGGPRELAVGGWTAYLLGTAVTAVGALLLAAFLARRDARTAAAAAIAGLTLLVWPGLLAAGADALAVVDHLVAGASWAAVGLLGRARPARPGREVPRPRESTMGA